MKDSMNALPALAEENDFTNIVEVNFGGTRSKDILACMKQGYAGISGNEKEISKAVYTRCIRQFAFWCEAQGITQPSRYDVIAFKQHLQAFETYRGKDGKTHIKEGARTAASKSAATVQNYIVAIRQFFKWASIQVPQLYPDIAAGLKGETPKKYGNKKNLLKDEVKAVLESIDRSTDEGKRQYALFALVVTAGLRTIEVSRAKVKDFTTEAGTHVLKVQGKGHDSADAVVALPMPVVQAIREYLATRSDAKQEAPLFTSASRNGSRGQALTTRSISGMLKACMVKAGFNDPMLTAHSLRHTAVTLALMAGEDPTKVQQFARHKSLDTTMIYSHALEATKNTCSKTVAACIFED